MTRCSLPRHVALSTLMLGGLAACANLQPAGLPHATPPASWSAPLPEADRTVELEHWWASGSEPELASLIEDAQRVSPSVAAAQARIAQARAQQTQARAALLPQVSAVASGSRTSSPLYTPPLTQAQAGLQMNWELSLASLRGADRIEARAGLESAEAKWHDARILVAAEVAGLYHEARSCRTQLRLIRDDAASRAETERLTRLSLEAGMSAAPALATARSQLAETRSRLLQQEAACEADIKGLVALSGRDESALRATLEPALAREGQPQPFAISALPARTLAQRPDVRVAEREVLQAQARVMQAESARLPRLSLEGFIGRGHYVSGGVSSEGRTWTFGPLALSLPLFDGGRLAAQQAAAEAELDASLAAWRASVRQAVREVEEALLQLQASEQRWQESRKASEQAHVLLESNGRLLQQGMLSQLDFEEIQRQARAAELNAAALDLERQRAWITLYRAMGGGFQPLASPSETNPAV